MNAARRRPAATSNWFNDPAALRERAAAYEVNATEQAQAGHHQIASAWRGKASTLRVRATNIETARSKG